VTVDFDSGTGRLRLDPQTCAALLAWADGAPSSDPALAELAQQGVIHKGRPHPALVPALEALTDPVCEVSVTRSSDEGDLPGGEGGVALTAAGLLLDAPGGLRELVTVHPTFLPAALATIVRLGPRPRVDSEPLHLPASALDGLLMGDPASRRQSAGNVGADIEAPAARAAVASLASTSWHRWAIVISWPARPGQPGERRLEVLDTPALGVWILEPATGLVVLWPSTPTAVWRLLTLLLPGDEELGLVRR